MHPERLMPLKVTPEGYKAVRSVEAYVWDCGPQMSLIELVKMRVYRKHGACAD